MKDIFFYCNDELMYHFISVGSVIDESSSECGKFHHYHQVNDTLVSSGYLPMPVTMEKCGDELECIRHCNSQPRCSGYLVDSTKCECLLVYGSYPGHSYNRLIYTLP